MPRRISTGPAWLGRVRLISSIWIKGRGPLAAFRRYGTSAAIRNGFAALALFLALPAVAETRLVAIGDSLTAGYGLPQDEGFVPQLDAWLAENGAAEVEVVNMGVSGDTTAGGKARLGWALGDGADAVILALGANDMLRGVDPATSRENLDAMLDDLDRRGIPVLLAGMMAPLNYGPDYKAAFDGMYPALAEEHDALLYPFFLKGVVGEDGESRESLFQDDGLHPNAEGVRRMVENIGPAVLRLLERTAP